MCNSKIVQLIQFVQWLIFNIIISIKFCCIEEKEFLCAVFNYNEKKNAVGYVSLSKIKMIHNQSTILN